MTTDRPFKDNKIFTEEMANAAREVLRDKLAKMGGEAPNNFVDADAEAHMIDHGDEDEDEEPSIDDLLPFTLEEQDLIDQLGVSIRKRMVSAEPEALKKIAAFLYSLERLPYVTPEISLDLAIMDRVDENLSYASVELDSQSFRLSTGGSVYSPDVGSDSYSETTFEIEAGGFREGSTQGFSDWLDTFVSTGGTIEIQGDDDADLSELAPDDGWDRLEKYWETHWEDEGGW